MSSFHLQIVKKVQNPENPKKCHLSFNKKVCNSWSGLGFIWGCEKSRILAERGSVQMTKIWMILAPLGLCSLISEMLRIREERRGRTAAVSTSPEPLCTRVVVHGRSPQHGRCHPRSFCVLMWLRRRQRAFPPYYFFDIIYEYPFFSIRQKRRMTPNVALDPFRSQGYCS